MGLISLSGIAKPLAAGAVALACLCEKPPEDVEGSLRQAAQHFADLEDDKAKTILFELAEFHIVEAKVLLGYLISDPLYATRDYESAVLIFEDAAASGSDEALFQIAESRFWPEYSGWTLMPDEKTVRPTGEETHWLLLRVADANHEAGKWRLAWFCSAGGYDCGAEAPQAVVTSTDPVAAEDEVDLACTKLSLPRYFERFGIEYRRTKRYMRCRELLLNRT